MSKAKKLLELQLQEEQLRKSRVLENFYNILRKDSKSIFDAQNIMMGLQAVIIKRLEKLQEGMNTSELNLADNLDAKKEEHKPYLEILELLKGENLKTTVDVIQKAQDLVSTALDRNNDKMKLEDLDINQLMPKYEKKTN